MKVLSTAWVVAAAMGMMATTATAQADTTRRVSSEQRIPVRKGTRIVRESPGEVALAAEVARINQLEESAAALRERVATLETERAILANRVDADNASLRSLESMLQATREDLSRTRSELDGAIARAAAMEQQIAQFERQLANLKYGSVFGNSGFYMALGTGMNLTTGTLHDVGYGTGMNVVMPIGWSKPGQLLGVRAELAAQMLDGNPMPGFANIDPVAYSANAMLTFNLPLNAAKTNLFYLMGGGGVFMFDRIGERSALADRLGEPDRATKFGLTGGAGLELHVLGATSLFVQSAFTNVFGEKPEATLGTGRSLRWVPLVAGITLR